MNNPNTKSDSWAAKNTKNTRIIFYWTSAWVLTTALVTFGTEFIWQSDKLLTSLAILLNVVIGFGMILAVKRYLKGLDEMQQKIQLDAMALSLGVGLVVGLGYSSMDQTNLIPFDAEISHLIILMSLTYIVGIFAGLRKYR
ncbi:MAG: hypothetical protein OEU84_03490 [Xanthomonadales bacterium]|nr:hypothetical protein [Xanthomonadales bacterium]MDH4018640.1 hypothetical protein [Xanthomonadales bacterium]